MRPSRRQFHQLLLSALALPLLPRAVAANTRDPADLWLNRLTFGATAQSRADFAALGPKAWLEDQLSRPSDPPDLAARLDRARLRIAYQAGEDEQGRAWAARDDLAPLAALREDPARLVELVDWENPMDFSERIRPGQEVIAASVIRAVHSPAELREVMAQFWHDHFNVNAMKDEFTAAFFPAHDRLMRDHAFGNFRRLLGAVARSPAMLYYLNNAESRASPANENYARELLELHTLGAAAYVNDAHASWHEVPGAKEGLALGYMDLDVYEVARAFTGWTVGDGRWISDGVTAPRSGQFHYVEAWHDPYQKRVLGVEMPPNRAPMADGDQVLDILARHPATAEFLCGKIARRLLADDPPPDLVARLAQVFLAAAQAPDQIAQVIRALVLSPEFAATPPSKLRRPFEFLAALYRASGAEVTGVENAHQWQLMRAGWRQHEYPVPTGHPDVAAAWTGATALNRLVDYALYAHDDWFGVARLDTAAREGETIGAFADRFSAGFGALGLAGAMGMDPGGAAGALSDDERHGLAAGAMAFAALTPEFLLR